MLDVGNPLSEGGDGVVAAVAHDDPSAVTAAAVAVAAAVTDGSPWLAPVPAPAPAKLAGELPMSGKGNGAYLVDSSADTEGGEDPYRCCWAMAISRIAAKNPDRRMDPVREGSHRDHI